MAQESLRRCVLGVACMLVAAGCRGPANVGDAEIPKEPQASTSAAPPASSMAANADAGAPAIDPYADLPKVHVVLDDPRLAAVRERERVRDYVAAARAMDEARKGPMAAALGARERCAWSYAAGALHLRAGSSSDAASAFDAASGFGADGGEAQCPLDGYALLRAGEAFAKLARWDEAAARLARVPDELAVHEEVTLALAEALFAKGDRAKAVSLWRGALSSQTARWAETSARLASALLDGADGPADAHAQEAFDLASRVVVEAPKLAEALGVTPTRTRAIALLKAKGVAASESLSRDERAHQAQAWLEAGEPQRALAVAEALLAQSPRPVKDGKEAACKASIARAQASSKVKQPASQANAHRDTWGDAIAYCDGETDLATALYFGGKSSRAAHRLDEATQRFGKVEQLFPKHRYADDARFQAALIAEDNGDLAKFESMLSTLPDTYPDGDLRGEALFRVAFAKITRGDLEAAKAPLDRAIALDEGDHHWSTAGRSTYFRARVAEQTGDKDGAKAGYAKVIAADPLAYYMALAYARLASLDRNAAAAAMNGAIAKEPEARFFTKEHGELSNAGFERATALLEVGEIEAARRELSAAKMIGDGADSELVWVVAHLFDDAGAPEVGHAFARARVSDHLAHYPAGRWRLAWEAAFPKAFASVVEKESKAYGIPAPLTWAIMREESGFHPDARSPSNAHGLMQLLPSTAREVAKGTGIAVDEISLHLPENAVPIGAKLLAALRRSFAGNPALAIAAYNSGSGAVRRWLDARGSADLDVFVEQIPYDETRGYVKRVLASQAAYSFLYARPALDEVLSLPLRARGGG